MDIPASTTNPTTNPEAVQEPDHHVINQMQTSDSDLLLLLDESKSVNYQHKIRLCPVIDGLEHNRACFYPNEDYNLRVVSPMPLARLRTLYAQRELLELSHTQPTQGDYYMGDILCGREGIAIRKSSNTCWLIYGISAVKLLFHACKKQVLQEDREIREYSQSANMNQIELSINDGSEK